MPIPLAASSSAEHGAIVPIASQTVSAAAGSDSLYFNNIPQTYQDLMVVWTPRINSYSYNTENCFLRINNTVTGTTFSSTWMQTNGITTSTSYETSQVYGMRLGMIAPTYMSAPGTFGSTTIHILNYTSSTANKTILCKTAYDVNGTGGGSSFGVGLWSSTAPVTGLNLYGSGNFATNNYWSMQGTTCTVYGVRSVGQ